MNAIILEDEALASRRLKRMLDELFSGEVQVIETYESVRALAGYLEENEHPDLLFLDIMVADGNSFDLFDLVKVRSQVIFITAYNEFAAKAFRKNAVDYLMKPLKNEELKEAVEKVKPIDPSIIERIKLELEPYKQRFLIRFGNKLHSVRTQDISYIYSEDKLSFFVQRDGKRVAADLSMRDIMESLDPHLFFRANRQIILSINSIQNMIRYSRSRIKLILDPPFSQEIIVSTDTTPEFKKWMDR